MRVFTRVGYEVVRQRGSHVRLRHPSDPACRVLKPGLLRALLRDAQIEVEEFRQLLSG
ncbi:MAG: type II toxin-antitoxin system HicA family toxin [Candidatus Rokuibacteriota bacterium]